jgi:hypothetical protein
MGLLVLLFGFLGCGGGGGGGGSDAATAAGDAGRHDAEPAEMDAGPGVPTCLHDDQCPDGQWCRLDGLDGACVPGCRTAPDTCAAADPHTLCDPDARTCVARPCAADADCAAGNWCHGTTCEPGCRTAPDDCGPVDGAAAACDAATHRCTPLQACCDAFDACTLVLPSACGGDALAGVTSCDPLPCTAHCAADADCAAGEFCAPYGRCADGCRPGVHGDCPADQACDVATRRCAERACAADHDCEAWQYCDGRVCADGCRDGGCGAGQRCGPDHTCTAACAADADCGAVGYCDAQVQACRAFCDPATHDGCRPEERCEADTRRCEVGCRPDAADLGAGDDTPDHAALVNLQAVPGGRAASLPDRGLCPGDVDFVAVPARDGERVQLTLSYDAADGAASLAVYTVAGDFLAGDDSAAAPKQIRLSAPGDLRVEVRGVDVAERVPYRLDVAVVPADGCFPDARDPGDDRPDGARAAGQRPLPDFTDAFDGSLCGGDADWFCFPMSRDDGLEVTVVAPAGCSPLAGELFDRARFDAGEVLPAATLGEGAPADDGATVYRYEATPDQSAFSAAPWCLRLHGADAAATRCEGYGLTLGFHRRGAPCTDAAEPDDRLDETFQLDGNGPLGDANGRLPPALDLELPLATQICADDVDLYAIDADAGDTLRAWIVGDGAGGQLDVSFLDENGQPQGHHAGLNAPDEDRPDQALALAVAAGRFYVRVRGVGAATGTYALRVRRDPGQPGVCVQDVNEHPGASNDLPDRATDLEGEDPRRPGVLNGSLCGDADDPDEDWYRFHVDTDRTRLCAAASFRGAVADIDLELYRGVDPAGRPCRVDTDCAGNGPGAPSGRCIGGHCAAALAASATHGDGEAISLPKAQVDAGDYLLRVFSPTGGNNLYDLQVTMVPESPQCERDWRERDRPNDNSAQATFLGAGRALVCDAWICHDERATGDWYAIHVPVDADRTVLISYAPREDGVLLLTAVDPDDAEGFAQSFELQASVQCINIEAGDTPHDVYLNVAADSVVPDGDTRVDYALDVVPTDLISNPRGACDTLSGNVFRHVDWPTLRLP